MEVTKVVIPAAGLGKRFLPFTKAVPKEMLPLLDKPAIHAIVQEAVAAQVNQLFFITSQGKEAIANYFDHSLLLDSYTDLLDKAPLKGLDALQRKASFTYIRQREPLGLGHAVLQARHCIDKEYFAVMLPDDIVVNKEGALSQLLRIAYQEKASVIAVQEVPTHCLSSYGVISIKKQITPTLFQVGGLVEKPEPSKAPSSLAIIGRYVLSHKVFAALDTTASYAENEIQLTDAIAHMVRNGEKVLAYKVQGMRYDLGTPLGWLKAVIGHALAHPEYGKQVDRILADLHSADSVLYNKDKALEQEL